VTLKEIHARLKERFPQAIADWQEPEAGDAFILADPMAFHEVARFLRDDPQMAFDYLRLVSAVDWTDRLSSVYHLYSYTKDHDAVLRVDLDRTDPHVASVADLWPTAEWHEREAYDLMGIVYEGHPGLRRIFMPEDWEGFPLRKDYQQPKEYHGITNE
jgi:NADH-quinone oxidoreductase subunit C